MVAYFDRVFDSRKTLTGNDRTTVFKSDCFFSKKCFERLLAIWWKRLLSRNTCFPSELTEI